MFISTVIHIVQNKRKINNEPKLFIYPFNEIDNKKRIMSAFIKKLTSDMTYLHASASASHVL